MKRLLLGLVTLTALFANTTKVDAQTFTTAHDTVWTTYNTTGPLDIHNDITVPQGGNPIYVKWSVTATDFSTVPSWSADSNVSVCDNYNCYTNFLGYLLGGNVYMSDAYAVGQTGLFKLTVNIPNGANGTHYVTINMKDSMSAYNKNVTFMVTKYPVSTSSVRKSAPQEISLYPNPASDDLNVVFDDYDNIKSIAVYNVIGKAMIVYKVNGNSAKMDISKLPNGVYFIRLSDNKGQVVGTKRFTKQ
ncbi:MAG: T9SS type A sorting domain-containing protein [Flavipsychrobacter sp.]|nr:T9SS type A sorting domain-containing protein [Flavipsychrobacter sp.]